jgi:hypothetical protein
VKCIIYTKPSDSILRKTGTKINVVEYDGHAHYMVEKREQQLKACNDKIMRLSVNSKSVEIFELGYDCKLSMD